MTQARSLRNLINTGTGQPDPKEDGDAPAHQGAPTELRAKHSTLAIADPGGA